MITKRITNKSIIMIAAVLLVALLVFAFTTMNCSESESLLIIEEQGSFAVGGTVITEPGTFDPILQGAYDPSGPNSTGQTLHGDHAYVFYQIPKNARELPLVFWHGYGQSTKTWESTPDGREGFQNIFLRRGFSVYLLDQPRRGEAGKSTVNISVPVAPDEQTWFGIFRLGVWPDYYDNVAFPRDEESLNQFFRQAVPSPNSFDVEVNTDAVSALFDKIGPGILVTHSASGPQGWATAIKNSNVKAIVSYEPGIGYPYPESDAPDTALNIVSDEDFEKLTQIPIVIYFGDNIPDEPSTNPGQEQWRVFMERARQWAEVVNSHGGDVTIVHLPEIGIIGNTHFPFSDTNNLEVADELSKFLHEKKLD